MNNSSLIFGSGLSSCKDYNGLLEVCRTALSNQIVHFDTAPSYRTEAVLSSAVRDSAKELGLNREDYAIQTKIDPIQMYNGNVEEYFKSKLKEMQFDYVEVLLIHWPVFNYLMDTWASMNMLKEQGLVKHIGICNLRISHLEELKEQGIIPEVLQIERHPLNTFEREVQFCKDNGIILQDYSPLCKMHPRIKNHAGVQLIAAKYGCNVGQIILKWHIDTGAIPVFTSTKSSRIAEYAKLGDFSLTNDEIRQISSLNCNHKLYLESLICPGF